ncbi:MAG: hypothetical protein LLG04_17480, partial [Parachlamydia sp.]|nr:hypothetical protein [Parachlamydia sp.]
HFSRPIIVSFDSGHLYALQLKNPDSHWRKLGKKIFYSPTDHWGIAQIPFSPYHELGQEQVMLFHMRQPDNKGLFVIAHESFHLHQFAHFPAPSLSGYCDQMNAANLALMQVEEATLAHLLGQMDFQIEILKDFIAVNQTRYLFISPSSVQWEQHQQLMEGLADYSAYRLLEAANIDWADWPYDTLVKPIDSLCDYAMKWRHYAMGAALGMLLDHLNVERWREQTESTGRSPGEWLSEAIALPASEVQERLEIARLKYHHSDIEGIVVKEVETYAKELESHMTNHRKSPGTLIRLGSLPLQGGSGGGRNAKSFTLPEGGSLSIRDSSTAISDDQTWRLKLVNIAHLFQLEGGIREFKLVEGTEMIIDGKKVDLQHLALIPSKRHFRQLQWTGKQGEFSSSGHDGTLEVDVHGCVSIRFLSS